ncbi:hypothetical protein KFK14_19665 [Sphingobium phenoxybenzoativorans]|uniref:Uncharacterized protein n=1 Tax=Sphingobium phenoxybenzoativorans TaxID=1592790 RepID=A0A975K5I8_9SPHN|nr:hypothetical protein [Sphingobium phenoxybenzoativorans]QUT05190.1 hypothetical protein KFK14_19665 [Sphingobium phenoxybenzoativorans]
MCDPTSQDYFSHVRSDDLGIQDEHNLIRHCKTPYQVVPCPINGLKVSSQAFTTRKEDPGVSIDIECLLHKAGLPSDARFGEMPGTVAMVAVAAKVARSAALGAAWTPKPEVPELSDAQGAANPYHGEVIVLGLGSSARKRASRALSESAVLVRSEI